MTERDRWSLRGPVHTCRVERTWFSRRCGADACDTEERSDASVLEFRKEGSLALRQHRNPDGSTWTANYEYDSAGRLIVIRTSTGTAADLQVHEYDADGRLVRVIARHHGAEDRVAERYEYDSAGRKTRVVYVDLAGQRPDTGYGWGVEGTDSVYSAPGAVMLTTAHNERAQPAAMLFHDADGRLINRVEFTYDPEGNLIEEAQITPVMLLPSDMLTALNEAQIAAVRVLLGADGQSVRRTYLYDEHRQRVETRTTMGALGEERKSVTYNQHGDIIQEVCENSQREYGIDDQGRLSDSPASERVTRSEASLRYEYDAYGNWIQKTVESRSGPDEDFTVCSVERRTIGYFE